MMVMIVKAIDDYKRQQIVQIIVPIVLIEMSKNHMMMMEMRTSDGITNANKGGERLSGRSNLFSFHFVRMFPIIIFYESSD